MKPWQDPTDPTFPRRIMVADWARLTDWERDQALEVARWAGQRAAQWDLAEAADGSAQPVPLRRSRWAAAHEELDQLDDDIFFAFASAHILVGEDDYFAHVIEPFCPERVEWWWSTPPAERAEDPRLCAFCDGYERRRCNLLGIAPPPTGITDLQLYLVEAQELERERARIWFAQSGEIPLTPDAETEQKVVSWEYERCTLATDLAQMLLDAALHRAHLRRRDRNGLGEW